MASGIARDRKNRRVFEQIGNFVVAHVSHFKGKLMSQAKFPVTRCCDGELVKDTHTVVESTAKENLFVADVATEEVHDRVKEVISELKINPSPKTSIEENIDKSDVGNQLAAVDYAEDIYKFYKCYEQVSRPNDYIHHQLLISKRSRAAVAHWLIAIHHKLALRPETLFLAFSIFDRLLSAESIFLRELKLVGICALHIASKYEEIQAQVNDFRGVSDGEYSHEEVLAMETEILIRLEWKISFPTTYVFVVRFLMDAECDKQLEHMVFFLAELSLTRYSMIKYYPSMVAASAVYAARRTLKKTPFWTESLELDTGLSVLQILDCARALVQCHLAASRSSTNFLYAKYSLPQFGSVALLQPAGAHLGLYK